MFRLVTFVFGAIAGAAAILLLKNDRTEAHLRKVRTRMSRSRSGAAETTAESNASTDEKDFSEEEPSK